MTTWRVPLTTWASITVDVETDETDPVVIARLAEEQAHASLCHQCANVDLGDEWTASGDTPEELAENMTKIKN